MNLDISKSHPNEKSKNHQTLRPRSLIWRIIPLSRWLVTPIYKPFRPFRRGTTLLRGLTITMVMNHVSHVSDDPPNRQWFHRFCTTPQWWAFRKSLLHISRNTYPSGTGGTAFPAGFFTPKYQLQITKKNATLPETNILAPGNGWLEY